MFNNLVFSKEFFILNYFYGYDLFFDLIKIDGNYRDFSFLIWKLIRLDIG